MQIIRPEFIRCAALSLNAAADASSESDTQTENQGILTLEMRDNPFQSLMRRINRLLDTGLREDRQQAFELTRSVVLEGMFERDLADRLNEKLGAIIELIHEDNLCTAFTLSALDIRPGLVLPETAQPQPGMDFTLR